MPKFPVEEIIQKSGLQYHKYRIHGKTQTVEATTLLGKNTLESSQCNYNIALAIDRGEWTVETENALETAAVG